MIEGSALLKVIHFDHKGSVLWFFNVEFPLKDLPSESFMRLYIVSLTITLSKSISHS